ncbi:efflux RND transporter periplasmic adaptor subunit [Brevibacillus ginsengisoli]|uniref:efflux RND transporter periplasmic adaptor subunit n=1 Tax=Brevibacillus ginsengisoli TaxID=363854 RepID=UPI003CF65A97
MRKRWWVVLTAGVAAVGIGGFLFLTSSSSKGVPVQVAAVTKGELKNLVLTSGQIKVQKDTTLYAQSNGTLRNFQLQEGDQVRAGQVVGIIDMSDMDSKILDLEAQIQLQEANLSKAQKGIEPEELSQFQERVNQSERDYQTALNEFKRTEQLYQSSAITKQELDKGHDSLLKAESDLEISKQNLALKKKGVAKEEVQTYLATIHKLQVEKGELEKDRVHRNLIAPAEGSVLSTYVKNGQSLSKGNEVILIGDVSNLVVEADVDESDVHKIKLGQVATIQGSSLGKEVVKAKVTRIAPTSTTKKDSQTDKNRVVVTLELIEKSSVLKPGFHVDVNIEVEKAANTLQVPIEAVQQADDGSSYVWVTKNGTATKQKIEPGIENELFMQIKSGVNLADKVILNPPEHLKANDPVYESNLPSMPSEAK